jgi:hypothetical protein
MSVGLGGRDPPRPVPAVLGRGMWPARLSLRSRRSLRGSGGEAAVDGDRGAGDVAAAFACEVGDQGGDVLGAAVVPEAVTLRRNWPAGPFSGFMSVSIGPGRRDAMGAEVAGQASGEPAERGLGHGIQGEVGAGTRSARAEPMVMIRPLSLSAHARDVWANTARMALS